ncbi:Sua5/YciO/YrdC/YwlC family protein, partial [Klebsiella pneumoniae]
GLRVPLLPVEAAWLRAVLEMVDMPLPTTSVNRSGEPPLRDFTAAALLLAQTPGCFVPSWRPMAAGHSLPSTVIRLQAGGGYTMIREGAVR